jgi:hypothetical protein
VINRVIYEDFIAVIRHENFEPLMLKKGTYLKKILNYGAGERK